MSDLAFEIDLRFGAWNLGFEVKDVSYWSDAYYKTKGSQSRL